MMDFQLADLRRDYKILLQAKKDVLSFIESKDYLNSTYYLNLTQKIDFTN